MENNYPFFLRESSSDTQPNIIVMNPNYTVLQECSRASGCSVTYWEGEYNSKRGWFFDITELRKLVIKTTQLLVVNAPQNPTNWLPTQDEVDGIVEFCREHDLYLLWDEVYALLPSFDGPFEGTEKNNTSICDMYDKGVVVGGLSKTMSLPGLRIGWAVTKNKVL